MQCLLINKDRQMADSGNPIRNLELHIEQWLLAYGSDLAIPAGTATGTEKIRARREARKNRIVLLL